MTSKNLSLLEMFSELKKNQDDLIIYEYSYEGKRVKTNKNWMEIADQILDQKKKRTKLHKIKSIYKEEIEKIELDTDEAIDYYCFVVCCLFSLGVIKGDRNNGIHIYVMK